ncbi:MAG: DNA polymerase III subunit alpha [Deltaproteobacteria bacterium]|jgi:DNA polymerase-3 subunit alpha|nr:DNA polymerase III subunit alpha [Deltaproteobacteria bacterium]
MFVHLHVHSCYSLLDGAIRVKDLVQTASKMGMPAVALTDHGQMMGIWAFYQAAKEVGIKPILGVEAYVANHGREKREPNESRHHLILLAQNMTGYRNLCRLVSLSNLEGFYNKPRVDKELLAQYNEGLIALSACLQGELPQEILRGSSQEHLLEIAQSFMKIFPDRFYLEIQENGLPQQPIVNEALIDLAQKASLPLVATNDCHYLLKEHHKAHDILLCVQTHKLLTDENRLRMESEEFYFKSPQEMISSFEYCPEAISNTLAIAKACEVEFPEKIPFHFPVIKLPEGQTADEVLDSSAQKGFEKRLAQLAKKDDYPFETQVYQERLNYELNIIKTMGFAGYFLIVAEFIAWAREHGVLVGPGRGSAAGSLVAWCLGIINVDPIRYGLLFERFLNPERVSMPDVDVDFCADGRAEVIRHVSETYGGSDCVAQIMAIGQLKAKAVIRDVGRVLGMGYQEVDTIAKLIPNTLGVTIDQAIAEEPRLAKMAETDPAVKSLLSYARLLENLPRHSSVHASGVVFADKPLMEYLPLSRDAKSPEVDGRRASAVTQYELNGVEKNGLIKFDFLGLKTLTLIKHCLALLAKKGLNIDLDNLDFKDEATFDLLRSGQVNGVFQLESFGIRRVLIKMIPKSIEDISCLLALYRPGPIEGGHVDDYLDIRHGLKKAHSILPQADEILKETHGVIIYQEQAMLLAQVLAGYTLGQADSLRKAMGKKDEKGMSELKESFIQGAEKTGTPKDKAAAIFDDISKFAGYGFNKSHSMAYAVLTYWTAWLKTHYRAEFMAALLTSEMDKLEKLGRFIEDCRRDGLNVKPPDINASDYPFSVLNGDIIYGLGAIKGVGQGAVEALVNARAEEPFKDLFDFCLRVDSRKVNRRTIEALILSGSFDSTGIAREAMMEVLPEAMKGGKAKTKKKTEGGLFDLLPASETSESNKWPTVAPMTQKERLDHEHKYLGIFLSGHPLGPYEATFQALSSLSITQAKSATEPVKITIAGRLSRITYKKDKKDRSYAFVTLEDMYSSIDAIIWNSQLAGCQAALEPDNLVYISGRLDPGDERFSSKVIVNEMVSLDQALASHIKCLYIRAPLEELDQTREFLQPRLIDKTPDSPQVWLGLIDEVGEAFFQLTRSVALSPAFLTEAREALGFFGETHCLPQPQPFDRSDL